VIKRGVLIVVALTVTYVAAPYVVSAFRRISDRPADASSPARAGHSARDAVGDALYAANCAGCHGADARGGAARSLADPVFLRIADDATIHRVTADGVPGTAMPAFAKQSGGSLTDQQIDAIMRGIRSGSTNAGIDTDVNPPPYSTSTAGDAKRGADVYATFCSSCHGADGGGGSKASSIVDASYLSLVSDQGLRTTVIAGRPDLGAPDWRGDLPGRPMSSEEVSDVVAWLGEKRPPK
jgi:mono/diheme cytochrome c family protein